MVRHRVCCNKKQRIFIIYEGKRVHKLGLKNVKEWELYTKSIKKPDNIPSKPQIFYKNKGWENWGKFLGTGNKSNHKREYLSFEDAKNFVHKLRLNDQKEWQNFCVSGNMPIGLPSNPSRVYKGKGWNGLRDWLGTIHQSPKKNKYMPFKEASNYIQKLGLKNNSEWREYCKSGKKPDDIPSTPERVYKNKGWNGFKDWLGR